MSDSFAKFRKVMFRILISVSCSEIALGSVMLNNTLLTFKFHYGFNALGVAAGSLTFITIPIMLWLARLRKDSLVSRVSVEAGWTFVLWVLWLGAAVFSSRTLPNSVCLSRFTAVNISTFLIVDDTALCRENQVFIVISFIGWALLFFYNMALLSLALRQQTRGHVKVWSGNVIDTDFSAPSSNSSSAMYPMEVQKATHY